MIILKKGTEITLVSSNLGQQDIKILADRDIEFQDNEVGVCDSFDYNDKQYVLRYCGEDDPPIYEGAPIRYYWWYISK